MSQDMQQPIRRAAASGATGPHPAPGYAPPTSAGSAPPGYSPPGPVPRGYAPGPRTNVLAIVSLVAAFFVPLAAVICGVVAMRQIGVRGEGGKGLAIAGLVLGGIGCAFWVLFWVLIVVNGGSFAYSVST